MLAFLDAQLPVMTGGGLIAVRYICLAELDKESAHAAPGPKGASMWAVWRGEGVEYAIVVHLETEYHVH